MMAWEILDEPLEEQDEIENIGNCKIQFETDAAHEDENTKFNMKKVRVLHLRMMMFHTLNHPPPLQIMTIWNRKECEGETLLHGILLKILENGIQNPKNRKEKP